LRVGGSGNFPHRPIQPLCASTVRLLRIVASPCSVDFPLRARGSRRQACAWITRFLAAIAFLPYDRCDVELSLFPPTLCTLARWESLTARGEF
jgi:hypothetical protein